MSGLGCIKLVLLFTRCITDYHYTDCETKAKYVWLKYQPILRGRKILDVGADECQQMRTSCDF